jgi:hypothetical protein
MPTQDQLKQLKEHRIWEHHSGKLYVIAFVSNLKATKADWDAPKVVYTDIEGDSWTRDVDSFLASCKPFVG